MKPQPALIDLTELPSGTVIQCVTTEEPDEQFLVKADVGHEHHTERIEWFKIETSSIDWDSSRTPDLHQRIKIITTDIESFLLDDEGTFNEPG